LLYFAPGMFASGKASIRPHNWIHDLRRGQSYGDQQVGPTQDQPEALSLPTRAPVTAHPFTGALSTFFNLF
jgi:hypothetical protein